MLIQTVIILISSIFLPGLWIAGFVIGGKNMTAGCDDSKVINLAIWLVINSSLMLMMIAPQILFCIIYFCYRYIIFFLAIMILLILQILFAFAWNILGTYLLFRNGYSCRDSNKELFWMVAMVLLIELLVYITLFATILFSIMVKRAHKVTSKDDWNWNMFFITLLFLDIDCSNSNGNSDCGDLDLGNCDFDCDF